MLGRDKRSNLFSQFLCDEEIFLAMCWITSERRLSSRHPSLDVTTNAANKLLRLFTVVPVFHKEQNVLA